MKSTYSGKLWQEQLADSVTDLAQLLAKITDGQPVSDELRTAAERYPLRLTPHVLRLAGQSRAVARQFLPDAAELDDASAPSDPLREEEARPVPRIIRRYADRLLLMASDDCAARCRFCTRKGRVGRCEESVAIKFDAELDYIRRDTTVRQVILSGGDPLILEDDLLAMLLDELRAVEHVRVLRIHTRVPGVLPSRITPELCAIIRKSQPLLMSIHFNHPDEFTPEVDEACAMLADSGVPLSSQTVLLRGVNDDPATMEALMMGLLERRVMPYYLHHPDGTRGTNHFDVPVERGRAIIENLRRSCAGMAVPAYVCDRPDTPYKQGVVKALFFSLHCQPEQS